MARAVQKEVDQVEVHNAALRAHELDIPAEARGPLSVDNFCALKPVTNIEAAIEEAERRLNAARSAASVASTKTFSALTLPKIDLDALRALMRKALADVDAHAMARVQAHIGNLGRGGEAWIGQGMTYAGPASSTSASCPFCAQELSSSPIIAHYRAYFGAAYEGLKREIKDAATQFWTTHGGDVPAAFERSVRQTGELRAFWQAFAKVPELTLNTEAIARIWVEARGGVQYLFNSKAGAPLEPLEISGELEKAIVAHNAQCEKLRDLSEQLLAVNPELAIVKEQAADANLATLGGDLANLRAARARFDPQIAPLCDAYLVEKAAKAQTEQRRSAARAALDQHRATAFPAYGIAINNFLQRFNASFRVGPVDAVNNRGGSSANYSLQIDGHAVPLSGNSGEPSFRNTLSAGDRNTLALAFFFASLKADANIASKVVVIDDPMTSLDEHRSLHTLQELDGLAKQVAATVVLSHSKPFLFGVWDKCQQIQKTALEVRRLQDGSTLAAWDVNAAMKTEHDKRYQAAVDYIKQADPDAARPVAASLRPMLEMFCRVAYPLEFPPGTMLGPFQNQCAQKAGSRNDIMSATRAQELRALLDYANKFHHDTNATFATEIINDGELLDFTKRTLAFIRHL